MAVIGNYNVQVNQRETGSVVSQLSSFVDSTAGFYRVPKAASAAMEWVAEVAKLANGPNSFSDGIQKHAKILGAAANGTGFARTLSLTISTPQKINEAFIQPTTEKIRSAVDSCFEWVSGMAYSIFAFTGNPAAKNTGEIATLGHDVIDLHGAGSKYLQASELRRLNAQNADGSAEVTSALDKQKTYQLLKIAKAVAAVTAGVLALLAMTLGGAVVPTIVLLTLSVVASAFAIASHFYKENMGVDVSISDRAILPVAH